MSRVTLFVALVFALGIVPLEAHALEIIPRCYRWTWDNRPSNIPPCKSWNNIEVSPEEEQSYSYDGGEYSKMDSSELTGKVLAGDARAQFHRGLEVAHMASFFFLAADLWKKSAAQGYAPAQYNLGVLCYNGSDIYKGSGIPQDYRQAATWFRKAAEQGYADAQYGLGVAYDKGHGVAKDSKQAVSWFRKAAEQGNASGQVSLGLMYYNGQGVPKDIVLAYAFFKLAAKTGESTAVAARDLAANEMTPEQINEGEEVAYRQAATWLRKAAEQGNADAQYGLGVAYDKGHGVAQDSRQAANWFRKAAEQGNTNGQVSLGLMYYNGQDVPKDIVLAYALFNLAAEAGESMAVAARDLAAKEMTPEQIDEGEEVASQWQKGKPFPTTSKTGR